MTRGQWDAEEQDAAKRRSDVPTTIATDAERTAAQAQARAADQGPYTTATGRTLTDTDVQALADEAERGYPDGMSLDAHPAQRDSRALAQEIDGAGPAADGLPEDHYDDHPWGD